MAALPVFKTATGLPDAMERRHILAGDRPQVDLLELGDAYLAAGFYAYALDCFAARKDAARLGKLKEAVLERDAFVLERLAAACEVTKAEWERAARAMEGQGRHLEAIRLFRRAGSEADMARCGEAAARLHDEVKEPQAGRSDLSAPA